MERIQLFRESVTLPASVEVALIDATTGPLEISILPFSGFRHTVHVIRVDLSDNPVSWKLSPGDVLTDDHTGVDLVQGTLQGCGHHITVTPDN
jgi:hypothetical protein